MSIYKVYSIGRTWSWPVMSAPACVVLKFSPVTIRKQSRLTKIPENSAKHQLVQEFPVQFDVGKIFSVFKL